MVFWGISACVIVLLGKKDQREESAKREHVRESEEECDFTKALKSMEMCLH